jgi:UDP-N-acetylglucosamine 2-epimerase (non-hydrolysing)
MGNNKVMKVFVVMGTRPEAIKMAPLIQQFRCLPQQVELFVCTTGQHLDMLYQMLSLFEIQPDLDLKLMQPNQTPGEVAGRVLLALDPLLAELRPDWMLVQGDTTSVMASSIAAHYRGVRVGHVEAGLRTYDRGNPFPEEMNRIITDHVSDVHFAPTARARDCLLREGIAEERIHVTGNTVTDALLWIVQRPLPQPAQSQLAQAGLAPFLVDGERRIILVTAHRRENHGQPIRQICEALRRLADARPDCQIVYVVHRNPSIWQPVHELLGGVAGITLLEPVDYLTLVYLMKHSRLILTDSGGIQEEAPSLGVPVVVLRETTERPEAVMAGVARLVGTDTDRIVGEAVNLLQDSSAYNRMSRVINPYGDGRAAQRVIDVLLHGRCQEFNPNGVVI